MREENTKINYRPELAKELENILNSTKNLYELDFRPTYFYVLYILAKNKIDDEGFVKKLEAIYKTAYYNIYTLYDEPYCTYMRTLGLDDISDARAAGIIFNIFKDEIKNKKNDLPEYNSLSKMEKYMVDNFFDVLLAPACNVNLTIKDGYSKCYYDMDSRADFYKDLKNQVDFIMTECTRTIEIFNTSD